VSDGIHLSVVIPAFNEEQRIGATLWALREGLAAYPFDWEIRVVDDGSQDDTAKVVAAVQRADPRVKLESRPHLGKGAAARFGFLRARGDLRFLCDADLSMPAREISKFLAKVPAQCDIAIGSREGAGARRVGEPLYRHLLGRVFNAYVRTNLLPGRHDTQCGFKLFTARAVEAVFAVARLDGWAFDTEVLFIAERQGWRVKEVPIEWHYRDRSHVSALRDSWRMMLDIARIRINAFRKMY
jgi:dolichyl-phosphate beta-glucosyltransferase